MKALDQGGGAKPKDCMTYCTCNCNCNCHCIPGDDSLEVGWQIANDMFFDSGWIVELRRIWI